MSALNCGLWLWLSWRVYFNLQYISEKLREIAINPVMLKFLSTVSHFPHMYVFQIYFCLFPWAAFFCIIFIVPICFSCSYSLILFAIAVTACSATSSLWVSENANRQKTLMCSSYFFQGGLSPHPRSFVFNYRKLNHHLNTPMSILQQFSTILAKTGICNNFRQ